MIYQFKKMTSPAKTEEVTPTSSAISASKFQRTSKRAITTPEQTNANSEKTESVLTQEIKQIPINDRPKIISRTNKVQKTESILSNKTEQTQTRTMFKSRSPTQLPQIIQSPESKPIVNKIQKPKINSSKQISNNEVQDIKPIVLKKSAAIFYTISRLRKSAIQNAFLRLNQNKRKQRLKLDSEAKLLLLRSSQIPIKFQLNFYQEFIQKLKIIFSKKNQQTSKVELQMHSNNFKKTKQLLVNVLNFISKRKLKESFDLIKVNQFKKKNATKAVPTLTDFCQRRKTREAFGLLKQNSSQISIRKQRLLGALSNIFLSIQKESCKKGFNKIVLWASNQNLSSKKEPQVDKKVKNASSVIVSAGNKEQLSSKIQKLNNQKQKCQKQISALDSKLKKIKKEHEGEKKSLEKNIQSLKSDNKKYQRDIQQKKLASKKLKTQQSDSKVDRDELNANNDNSSNERLVKLQRIYFTLSRSQDQDISSLINSFLHEIKIDKNSSGKIVEEWQLILQKSLLQRQINSYENAIVAESAFIKQQNSIVKLVQEQNDMLKNMIRNYIKQRYLWSEVQKFVSSMV